MVLDGDDKWARHVRRAGDQVVSDALPDQPVETDGQAVRLACRFCIDGNYKVGATFDELLNQDLNELASGHDIGRGGNGQVIDDASRDVNSSSEQGGTRHYLSSMTGDACRLSATAARSSKFNARSGYARASAAG